MLTWIKHTLAGLLRRGKVDREIRDELAFHIEMETAERVREGLTPEEARRRTMIQFGSVERFREECRDTRGTLWFDELIQDLRVGVRALRGAPGFTMVVLLTLAIGVGATTAVFSVVYGVLLRPLPYAASDRIDMVWEFDRVSGTEREAASVPDYFDFVARSKSFDALAAFRTQEFNLVGSDGEPTRVSAAVVTHGLPAVLGIKPAAGRFINDVEDRPAGARVAVISQRLWRSHYSGDQAVVGQLIQLDGNSYQVIGVLPDEVEFPYATTDLWLPLQVDATTLPRSLHQITVIGRRKAGVPFEAAQNEMTKIAADLEGQFTENHGRGVKLEPIEDVIVGPVRKALTVLFGAVGAVLLIGCANLANLMLARAIARRREVAVRSVLGATVARLSRQFMVETAVVVLAGGVLAVLVARLLLSLLLAMAPSSLPRVSAIAIDGGALTFALIVSVVIALFFGSLPAWAARGVRIQETLKSATGRASAGAAQARFRAALVIAQIALSVVLVVGAGLLMRSFWLLQNVNPGFATENVLRASYRLPAARYPQDYSNHPNWVEVQRFNHETLEVLRTTPGVLSAANAAQHPLDPGFTNSFVIIGREAEAANQAEMPTRAVSADYFRTVGVPLLRGRFYTASDHAEAPMVLIINEAAARKYFPNSNPVGARIRFWGRDREIIGVVGNEHFNGLAADAAPAMYPHLMQAPFGFGNLLIRTAGSPEEMVARLRERVAQVDPAIALFDIEPLDSTLRASIAPQRFTATLLICFALVALVLALVGTNGLIAYTVTQRSREAGIRAALGATPGSVVALIVKSGARLALIGLIVGIIGAGLLTRFARTMLFGITALDPLTYVSVTLLIAVTVGCAIYAPARKLARVDPVSTLRAE